MSRPGEVGSQGSLAVMSLSTAHLSTAILISEQGPARPGVPACGHTVIVPAHVSGVRSRQVHSSSKSPRGRGLGTR